MILVSFTDVYSNPQFQFICSPWRLIESNRLIIENGTKIRVSIDLEPSSSLENRDISPDPKGPVPTSPKTQICPAPVQMTISPPDHDGAYPHLSYNILVSGQIRLLLLLPGDTHHTLRGSIYTCRSIPSAGPYRALSYVWGKARHSNHILVTENGVLHLKASLYTALVQLRHRKSPIVLWVDAICINQRDQPEKEQQIRLMPKIFQNAACTIAILGRGDQYGDAMKTLLQIRAKDAFGSVLSKWPATLLPVPHSWQQRPIPHPKDVIWNKIRQFFEQDWFRRAWIVQEAAVAPVLRIVCGTWTVDWADIYGAVLIVKRDQQFSNSMATSWGPFESLNDLRGWEARKSRWNLLTLLETFRHVGSTLKRDRFFALVGLASDGDKKEFDPECGRDVPFEHIACRFGRAFIAQGHGMQLLYQAGLGSQPDRFPSWLPDLTIPRPGGLGDVEADFNASKNRENQIRCLNENMVAVLGCLVDEIQELSESRNEPADGEQIHYFRDIDGMVGSLAGTYKPERLKELKWQVPVAGAIDPEIATMRGLELSESYESFREWLTKLEIKLKKGSKSLSHIDILSSDEANTGGEKPLTRRQKARVYSSILAGFKGWRFVTTKRRRCGIVPENAKKGDILTIFGGGNVPFLLRKSDSKPGAYRLVGACYINGIMDGESFSFQDVKQGTFEIH